MQQWFAWVAILIMFAIVIVVVLRQPAGGRGAARGSSGEPHILGSDAGSGTTASDCGPSSSDCGSSSGGDGGGSGGSS